MLHAYSLFEVLVHSWSIIWTNILTSTFPSSRRKKISDQADPPAGSGGGRTPSATSPVEDPLDRFETNPSRNRVLATADRVRRMLRAFTECSGHVDLGGMAKTEMCMENDSEVRNRVTLRAESVTFIQQSSRKYEICSIT